MPMYTFTCRECGHTFEELLLSSRYLDQVTCPECGSRQVERGLSRIAGLGGAAGGSPLSGAASCSSGGL